MIRRTINHMKTRPRHERVAFAGTISIGVVVVLLLGWAVFFLNSLRTVEVPSIPTSSATSSAQLFQ